MNNYLSVFPKDNHVIAVFSNQLAGDLKNNLENRKKFFAQFGVDLERVVFMNQVHSANVEYVDYPACTVRNTDAIFTEKKNVFLSVTTADCLPVFVYSKNPEFVGIIHAGWRGLINGILENFFKKTDQKFKLDYSKVKAAIGPCIYSCCFEIRQDVLGQFEKYKQYIIRKDNKFFVDLPKIAEIILTRIGLERYNIKSKGGCTYCQHEEYFSFRREKRKLQGQMRGFIGLI